MIKAVAVLLFCVGDIVGEVVARKLPCAPSTSPVDEDEYISDSSAS